MDELVKSMNLKDTLITLSDQSLINLQKCKKTTSKPKINSELSFFSSSDLFLYALLR